jgi:serine/threonine protein kinase
VATFIGRTLGGRYHVLELVGRGGSADTYRALDAALHREVAIKILVDRSEDVNLRLLRDAQGMASLHHPRIVEIFGVGQEPGILYIIMELVRGKTLRDLEGGSISYRRAVTYLIDVLEALEYAHARGTVHNDIKPGNVMTVGEGKHVKVMDFGLARRASDMAQSTNAGYVAAGIGYVAPERFLGKAADVRSDLYSVGVVAYEIFTGSMPFRNDGNDLVGTIFAHVHDAPTPPREINRNVPDALGRIIMRAIDKDPRKRYQNAREFINGLEALIAPASAAKTAALESPAMASVPEARPRSQRAAAASKNPNDAYESVLKGMLATRRRRYDEAKSNFTAALAELRAADNNLEYAKTALKYGTMILQKASDGLRDREELENGIRRLNEALETFRERDLAEQMSETEYLINALERTGVGY